MAVVEEGVGIYSRDVLDLYEYFYPFRRVWDDQKHRQKVSMEEMQAVCRARRDG